MENLLRDSDEEEFCRIFKRGAWHPFGRGGWEVREIRDEIAAQVVDREWTRTLKATNIPTFSVVNLGLTNTLNENHTELNFFELPSRNFGERNQLIHSAESRSDARSKRKQNNFLTSALLVLV